jgi:hypothetical protein
MKAIETLLRAILSLVILLSGCCLVFLFVKEDYFRIFTNALNDAMKTDSWWLLLMPGFGMIFLGVWTLIPMRFREHKPKTIAYAGTHGDVVIELDSIERNLNRVIGKMSEVKWIVVTVLPDEDKGKASVTADVKLNKGPGESARETANRVGDRLAEVAANLLGTDDITHVDLIVKGISLSGTPVVKHAEPAKQSAPVKQPEPAPAPVEEAACCEDAACSCAEEPESPKLDLPPAEPRPTSTWKVS